jgi:hypothetical protein
MARYSMDHNGDADRLRPLLVAQSPVDGQKVLVSVRPVAELEHAERVRFQE